MPEVNFSASLVLPSGWILPSRVLLSPMEGIQTPAFVRAATALRLVDFWITPFYSVSPDAVPSKQVLKRRFAPYFETGLPFAVQLIGHAPAELAACAAHLEEIGVKAINLNLACPSKTVLGHGNGGALLKNPDAVNSIVAEVKKAISAHISLSVKLRAGYDSDAELKNLIAAVEDAELIVFHYRTVLEMYHPIANGLERLRKAVESANNISVIGNGDIQSLGDARRMVLETGCAGVALARFFLKNPGILNAIRNGEPPSPATSRRVMLSEMRNCNSELGPLLEFARTGMEQEEFRSFLLELGISKKQKSVAKSC